MRLRDNNEKIPEENPNSSNLKTQINKSKNKNKQINMKQINELIITTVISSDNNDNANKNNN